jgi:hypothetical protein
MTCTVLAQAIGAIGSSGPAGGIGDPAIRAAAKQLSSIGPWDTKRCAPLLKAQPADANLRSLFGFRVARNEPLVAGSKYRNGSN